MKTRTPEQARAWLKAHGIEQNELAKELGVPRMVIVDLLRGRCKGDRGASHKAAIALGLKPAPDPNDAPVLPRHPSFGKPKSRRAS